MTLDLLDHPVVREAAEGMAREAHAALVVAADAHGCGCVPWDISEDTPFAIEAHARLLVNLDRPSSRDHWIRWGEAHEVAAVRARECAEGTAYWRELVARKWLALRDNPEALASAVVAALEVKP